MTTVTRRTPTCATSRSEHACTLFRLSRHSHWYITSTLAQVSWVCHPIFTPCTCAVVSKLLDFSFYLSPHFTFFFPSFLSMHSNDFDSVTNNLRDSANGTFVTSDDTFPNTENIYTFDRWSCTRRFIAKVPRTSGKALTTRSRDKDLYWCRIHENSWSRTVHHDRGHWRVLTIYRTSDMSWVFFATRRKINWPERLDSREHQHWARVRSRSQLLAR